MSRRNSESSPSSGGSRPGREGETQHRPTPYGAARYLASFLNAAPESFADAERKLQAAMRELCGHVLEDVAESEGDRRFGLHRLDDDPMNVIWFWYENHPCVLNLMGWDRATRSPLQSVYRGLEQTNDSEGKGTLAAFSLWLLFLLADTKAYRQGKGLIFQSTSGNRMRLLKCAVCGEFFIRTVGRVAPGQNACDRCQLPRKRGPRDAERFPRKVRRRLARLRKVWRETPWRLDDRLRIFWEPRGPRPTIELASRKGVLYVSVYGGEEAEEREVIRAAVRRLQKEVKAKRGS